MKQNFLIDENETLDIAIKKILVNSMRTVLVQAKNKKIIGVFSEGDIIRSILQKKNLNSPAYKVMNKSFKYLLDVENNDKAREIFIKHNISLLPVISKNFKLLNIITLKDLFN